VSAKLTIKNSAPIHSAFCKETTAAEAATTQSDDDKYDDEANQDTSYDNGVILNIFSKITAKRNIFSTVTTKSFVFIIKQCWTR
jgi:hypothetical protein